VRRLAAELRWWAGQVSGDARYAAYVDRYAHPEGRCC
jgi:hypothetical protein